MRIVEGTLAVFDPIRNHGFADIGKGANILVHSEDLYHAGIRAIRPGDLLRFELHNTQRGLRARKIEVVAKFNHASPVINASDYEVGTIKTVKPNSGYAIVHRAGGGEDVFLHADTAKECGLTSVWVGQKVLVRHVQTPKGRRADSVLNMSR